MISREDLKARLYELCMGHGEGDAYVQGAVNFWDDDIDYDVLADGLLALFPEGDLRTALTGLVAHYKRAYPERAMHAPAVRDLDALLAAHPAPETDEAHHPLNEDCPEPGCRNSGTHGHVGGYTVPWQTAPVSDTRREDVARRIRQHGHVYGGQCACGVSAGYGDAHSLHAADAVLAALPASPVVDEAEIADAILARYSSFDPLTAQGIAAVVAARLRGATRG